MSAETVNDYTTVFTTDWEITGIGDGKPFREVCRLMNGDKNESFLFTRVGAAHHTSGVSWTARIGKQQVPEDYAWPARAGDQLFLAVCFQSDSGSATIRSPLMSVLAFVELFRVTEVWDAEEEEVNLCQVPWGPYREGKFDPGTGVSRLIEMPGSNGKLKLRVKIEMKFDEHPNGGSELLRSIYWSRYMSDFAIEVEGVSIPVHKTILGQKSTVFRTMFESPQWTETSNGVLGIDGFPKDAVIAFVESFYEVPLSFDDREQLACSVLALAEMYDRPDLKKQCGTSLEKMISLKNVCHLVVHADLHRASSLKAKCIEFAVENSRRMLTRPEWNDLQEKNPAIAWEIARGAMGRVPAPFRSGRSGRMW